MLFESIVWTSGQETSSHCDRVGEYVYWFLKDFHLGYTKEEREYIVNGAKYHDIGKAFIPKEILYKSNGLTDEEWSKIKEHPELGHAFVEKHEEILTDVEREICKNIVLLHHCRNDGSGYPHFEGEIPLYVQLVSVVDVFDALTSPRCYQSPRTAEEAFEMMENGQCGLLNADIIRKLKCLITRRGNL